MKKLIKQLLRENLLDEAKISYDEIPKTVILLNHGNRLTLYDTYFIDREEKLNGVLGTMTTYKENELIAVETVAAEKGYGPVIYELAMEMITPKALVSDRDGDTREGATKILRGFKGNMNPNITAIPIKQNDINYNDCSEIDCNGKEPDFIEIYNTKFIAKNNTNYNILIKKGEEFFTKKNREYLTSDDDNLLSNKEYIKLIYDLGREYFKRKY